MPHSNCHISKLTVPIEVLLNILESSRHDLRITHGFTLMTPSFCGWEVFLTPGSSPTLRSLGPSHQRRDKSRVLVRGPLCAHNVLGIPYGEVCHTHPLQAESMPSSTILVFGTPILKLLSFMMRQYIYLKAWPLGECTYQPKIPTLNCVLIRMVI